MASLAFLPITDHYARTTVTTDHYALTTAAPSIELVASIDEKPLYVHLQNAINQKPYSRRAKEREGVVLAVSTFSDRSQLVVSERSGFAGTKHVYSH